MTPNIQVRAHAYLHAHAGAALVIVWKKSAAPPGGCSNSVPGVVLLSAAAAPRVGARDWEGVEMQ